MRQLGLVGFCVIFTDKPPIEAVSTWRLVHAFGCFVVLENDVVNHRVDTMIQQVHVPPQVSHHVVDTYFARMAGGLHGITRHGA